MEIEFFGANCFRIKTKKTVVVVDDNLSNIGGKTIISNKETALYTNMDMVDEKAAANARLMIDGPGEYEVGDLTITGVQARSHTDTEDQMSATIFQFMADGQSVSVLGHVHPDISIDVTEFIAGTDVLIIPVGGNGYTLDPTGAAKIIKKAEPGVIIPSQYEVKGLSYEVPAQALTEFGKLPNISLEDPQDSYKLGGSSVDDGATQSKVVVLNVKSK